MTEHKLSLHEFFGGRGRAILKRQSELTGQDDGELHSLLVNLPDLDVYIPHPRHRATWTPDTPIAVAPLVDEWSPLVGYLPGGARLAINRLSADPTPTAVLVLGPSEPKSLRREWWMASEEWECLVLKSRQNANSCGGGGGGGSSPSPYLKAFLLVTHNIYDNGFAWETNEFEWRATAAFESSEYSPVLRSEGIGPNDIVDVWWFCGWDKVHQSAPGLVPYIDVKIVETDGWSNDDNFWDYQTAPGTACGAPPRVEQTLTAFLLWQHPEGISYRGKCGPLQPNPTSWVEVQFTW